MDKEHFDTVKMLYESNHTVAETAKLLNITYSQANYIFLKLKSGQTEFHYNHINEDFFETIDTEEKAYWLGFIQADGCIYNTEVNNVYKLEITLQESDKDHLNKFANIFNIKIYDRMNSSSFDGIDRKYSVFGIYSKKIFNDLINVGIEQRKTYSDVTNVICNVPDNLIHHFIRGVFDGDGCINCDKTNKGHFNISGSKDSLDQIQKIMVDQIGLNKTTLMQKSDYCWLIQYSGNNIIRYIYNWLYKDATVLLERKKTKFEEIKEVTKKYMDRTISPYRMVYRGQSRKNPWSASIFFNNRQHHIGNYPTELEAAYYHDLEQVRRRGNKAIRYMNFPSKYDDFAKWVEEGY